MMSAVMKQRRLDDPYEYAVDILIEHDFFLMNGVWQHLKDYRKVTDRFLRESPDMVLTAFGWDDDFDYFSQDPVERINVNETFKKTKAGKFWHEYDNFNDYMKDLCDCGAIVAKTTHASYCSAYDHFQRRS